MCGCADVQMCGLKKKPVKNFSFICTSAHLHIRTSFQYLLRFYLVFP